MPHSADGSLFHLCTVAYAGIIWAPRGNAGNKSEAALSNTGLESSLLPSERRLRYEKLHPCTHHA
jgi:hypothetical protein